MYSDVYWGQKSHEFNTVWELYVTGLTSSKPVAQVQDAGCQG